MTAAASRPLDADIMIALLGGTMVVRLCAERKEEALERMMDEARMRPDAPVTDPIEA